MSVTAVPIRPIKKGSVLKLWLGLGLLAALAILLAWVGTSSFRPKTLADGVRLETKRPGLGAKVRKEDLVALQYKLHINKLESPVVQDSRQSQQGIFAAVPSPEMIYPGFAAGLLEMRQGGSYVLSLPPGSHVKEPAPGAPFTPRDTLVFEIDVVQIERGGAERFIQMQQMQMMQRMQQMQQMQGGAGGPPAGAPEPGAR
jgi:FKBP-type peptidyl-prolyl cis-trans isomerase FkpA